MYKVSVHHSFLPPLPDGFWSFLESLLWYFFSLKKVTMEANIDNFLQFTIFIFFFNLLIVFIKMGHYLIFLLLTNLYLFVSD